MAIIKTDDRHYHDISAKIREKTGGEKTYKPVQMPSGVDEVYEVAYAKGKAEAEPPAPTVPTVTDGRTSLAYWYQPFFYPIWQCWTDEAYEENGIEFIRPSDRAYESLAFPTGTQGITDFTAFTKVIMGEYNIDTAQPIVVKKFTGTLDVSGATSLYALFEGIEELEEAPSITDTSHITNFSFMFYGCKSLVSVSSIDTSSGTNFSYMFGGCSKLVNAPEIDTSKGTSVRQMYGGCSELKTVPFINAENSTHITELFMNCRNLERVEGLRVSATTTNANTAFQLCGKLMHIIVEGAIVANNLNLKWSKLLDKESLTSIVNALSTETNALPVTLSLTAVKNAFETSQGAADGNTSAEWLSLVATRPNWTISLVDA